jgi:transcriptional regulator of acetoin/glycerol metabolism
MLPKFPEAFGEKTSPLDLHETEKKLIAPALAATNGNVTAAAKKLGISRRTLHRKINEMNQAKPPAARGSTTEDQRSRSSESAH